MPAKPKFYLAINTADLSYILACKLIAGRPAKDHADIELLCMKLGIATRSQAQRIVNRYFPDPVLQRTYDLPKTLDELFGEKS